MKIQINYTTPQGMASRKSETVKVDKLMDAHAIAMKRWTPETYTFTLFNPQTKECWDFAAIGGHDIGYGKLK